jgi:site-specific recombinase
MATGEEDPLVLTTAFITVIRPPNGTNVSDLVRSWGEMLQLLTANRSYRQAIRLTLLKLFAGREQRRLYAEAGLLPNTGFFSELRRRLGNTFLPELVDERDLKDCVHIIFAEKRDADWLQSVPIEERVAFWKLLDLGDELDEPLFDEILFQMLDSVVILAHRIAAMGLEQDLRRINPRLTEGESPFIALSVETSRFVERYRLALDLPEVEEEDERHLLVLLQQCRESVKRAIQVASSRGTSMTLTFLMVRLSQHLGRLELLIRVLAVRFSQEAYVELAERWSTFLRDALIGERRRNSILSLGSDLLSILALRVTENAGRAGEHYIAADRAEWVVLLRSAAGAGLIIPFMALLKATSYSLLLPILSQGLLNGMIYAGGFVIIHLCHFTVATKQPAMTAATIAGSVNQSRGRLLDVDHLVRIIVDTFRSQMAAIAGNVLIALLVATSLSMVVQLTTSGHLIGVDKARHLLRELYPLSGGALFYAAIAGIWLFAAGLVSGYMDNLAAYSRTGDRVSRLPWLVRALGAERAARVGGYLDQNLGGLTGNIFFGLMLGLTPAVGLALGLPLDIRHVAFGSANLGYALTALDFRIDAFNILRASAGVVFIGLVNLTVSFSLALWVAMRSRGADFSGATVLLPTLWRQFKAAPKLFFVPSREGTER